MKREEGERMGGCGGGGCVCVRGWWGWWGWGGGVCVGGWWWGWGGGVCVCVCVCGGVIA